MVVYSRCSINVQHLKKPFLSLWSWKIPFVGEGTEPQKREGTCPRSHSWREVERAGAWVPPLLTQTWPLHNTSGPSVCGPEPPQTHRCELMCHACPVELRIWVRGAQNDQCGPCVYPWEHWPPAEVGVCAVKERATGATWQGLP